MEQTPANRRIRLSEYVSSLITLIILCTLSSDTHLPAGHTEQPHTRFQTEGNRAVEVINNPIKSRIQPGQPYRMELNEELVIGGDTKRPNYLLARIKDLAVDDEGNIYILDNKQIQIKVFSKTGKLLRVIGRLGKGPGDIQSPLWVFFTGSREIMIEDHGNRRFIYFTPSGDFIRWVSFAGTFIFSTNIDSVGNHYGIVQKTDHRGTAQHVNKYSPDFQFLHTIASPPIASRQVYHMFKLFLDFAIYKNDDVIYGYPDKYEFKVFSSTGTLKRMIKKEYKPARIPSRVINYRKSYIRLPKTIRLYIPKRYPPFRDFTLDESGRLVVRTWEENRDGETYYDIFDASGHYISRLKLKVRPWLWKGNKLYTIETDENENPVVKRYHVSWY